MIGRRWGGWALLSSCLAIALAAVVLVMGMKLFRHHQQTAAVNKIEQDLKQIWQMGMDYYTTSGCIWDEADGVSRFAGESMPSWQQVETAIGTTVSVASGRDPWVKSYQLKVVREEEVADDQVVHAHYHLIVEASMQGLTQQQLQYLALRLQASVADEAGLLLRWDRLAQNADGRYQPLRANRLVNVQMMTEDGESQPGRQYCY